MERAGLNVKQQTPITVYYEQQVVGEFAADLLVEERLIIELKAVRAISKQHEAQLVGYLTATHKDVGLLINIGPSVEIRRKHR